MREYSRSWLRLEAVENGLYNAVGGGQEAYTRETRRRKSMRGVVKVAKSGCYEASLVFESMSFILSILP